jgi:transcription elongation factor GreA
MQNISYYTKKTLEGFINSLNNLKTKERKKISKQIAEAREKGDLKENAEYHAAKNAQGLLELKISRLKSIIANAKVILKSDIDISQVSILTKIKIVNKDNNKEFIYHIVSEEESDIKLNKISIKSPIAKGLLGKKAGDIAIIIVPKGKLNLKILDIFI